MTTMPPPITQPPTLLHSCAWAATAKELAYRIDAPPKHVRTSRVIALDQGAAAVVAELATMPWHDTKFLVADAAEPDWLADELRDADFVMMIATANDGAATASTIGRECARRGITTAGIVLGLGFDSDEAVAALRPHARVLLVTRDRRDVVEVLSEVGA